MNFQAKLKRALEEHETSLREEEAKKVDEKQQLREKMEKDAALCEQLAHQFVDPVLDEVNKSVAMGKGEYLRSAYYDDLNHKNSYKVSLTWNYEKIGYGDKGESIEMTVEGSGLSIMGRGWWNTREQPERIDLLKVKDAKAKIEDKVVDILRKGEQKFQRKDLRGDWG